jgi:hypothetical protein
VIGFELPGVSADSAQALICVCTKMLDDGRAATNIFGGVYGTAVVSGLRVPQIRDDLPGSFQIAVYWTAATQQANMAPDGLVTDINGFAAWWNTTMNTQEYWLGQIVTDRTVAVAYINQVLIGAGSGALAAGLGGLSAGPETAVLGACAGGMLGACTAAIMFINQPPPKPKNAALPARTLSAPTGTATMMLGARRASWGQVKARYAR